MRIDNISIDTTLLPVDKQFEHWSRHSDKTALSPIRSGPFLAQGTIWDLGLASIADCRLDPFVSDRTPAHVAAGGADFIQLVALMEGTVRLTTDTDSYECIAPDLFIRDYRQPSTAVSSEIAAIVLYLPSAFLQEAAGVVRYQGPLPQCPETAVLGSLLPTIVAALPTAAPTSAAPFVRALRSLIAAILLRLESGEGDVVAARLAGHDRGIGQLVLAKDYIAAQRPGRLSLEQMINDLGISRSVLFSLFKLHGGVLAYDRQTRLRALYRSLRDPGDARSLTELGEAHGFFDRSALANTFRRTFGRSQSEVRGGTPPGFTGDTPAERIHRLIAQLL